MKPGSASKTAELVAMGRALAHGTTDVQRFSDPTALTLLSDDARARIKRIRDGKPPQGWREAIKHGYLTRQSSFMVARTVAIDDAVRVAAAPQVVILGAGFDGRAWRMPELRDADVFEVDHPDSQAVKRERIGTLAQHARSVRFVPVDFTRDSLDDALAAAGHDPARRTTWIWEGVVMYLTLDEVAATLAVIARRSTPGSRVVVVYHSRAFMLWIVGLVLRRIGEPLRSAFTPDAMRALLARHGFGVVQDEDIATIGRRLSPRVGAATKPFTHMHVVVADRRIEP